MAYYQEIRYTCIVPNPSLLGDGICNNFNTYNTAGCNFDRGDCKDFNKKYPSAECTAPYPFLLGDGKCDGKDYNNPECNFDGEDCLEFNEMYPNCQVEKPALVGNGVCDGGAYNTTECGYDGGDCLTFWDIFLNCTVDKPEWIGDNWCDADSPYNAAECNYDNGDCAAYNSFLSRNPDCDGLSNEGNVRMIANSICDGQFNTPECAYDEGDCLKFNEKYPNCTVLKPKWIGDGECDSGPYNTAECKFDGGDCISYNTLQLSFPACVVERPTKLGDGKCDHDGVYNSAACNFDDGDCQNFNLNYANCSFDDGSLIGNGVCNGPPYNTAECNYDGGDCLPMDTFITIYPNCTFDDASKLGDGICDDGIYNTEQCGYDNGDCASIYNMYPMCVIDDPFYFGDGFYCNTEYNTPECGYDRGDCEEFNSKYPSCDVEFPFLVGTGMCSGGQYNVPECNFDGGDCDKFNDFIAKHPGCVVSDEEESWIADGVCNGKYNVLECSWDNGDCDLFNAQHPGCLVEFLVWLGDGTCDGLFNTAECAFDGEDCKELNAQYTNCYGVDLEELGDGICQHNRAGCNFDDGDCDVFNKLYPECSADEPYLIGDGYCHNEYDTIECKNDGGDCSPDRSVGFLQIDGGEIIDVDKYRQDTRTYSIIQIVSSLVSLVASIGIIWIIRRSFKGLSVPLYRLLLGLCIADICSSFAQTFGTLPAPDPFDVIWNAHGTKGSCQAQGFFIFLGSIAAPLYNCSICFYYYIVVTYKGRNPDAHVEGKIEFFLHAVPIVVALIGASIILSMDAFHPNMTYCFIGADPACEAIGCGRADTNAKVLFGVFSAGPYIVLPNVIIVTMALMYKAVRALERRMNRFGAGSLALRKKSSMVRGSQDGDGVISGNDSDRKLLRPLPAFLLKIKTTLLRGCCNQGSNSRQNRSRSNKSGHHIRAVLNRALSYSLAFLLTFLFPIIISIRTLNGTKSGHGLSILARIFFPLQGFLNFAVFIYPKVLHMKTKRRPIGTPPTTWYEAFIKAVQSRGHEQKRSSVKIQSRHSTSFTSSIKSNFRRTSMRVSNSFNGVRRSIQRMSTNIKNKSDENQFETLSNHSSDNVGNKNGIDEKTEGLNKDGIRVDCDIDNSLVKKMNPTRAKTIRFAPNVLDKFEFGDGEPN